MLQMSFNDNDYNWKAIFEEKPKESLSSVDLDYKSQENDVFKELTINIKKSKGKCIDEQFDQAIMSLHKSKILLLNFNLISNKNLFFLNFI
jgi:hypothetical protein